MFCSRLILKSGVGVLIFLLMFCSQSFAKKPLSEADAVHSKKITGRVSLVTDDVIAIVYKEDPAQGIEWEIDLPIDQEDLELSGVRNFTSIKVGDTISIDYDDFEEEYQATNEQGHSEMRKKVFGRKAKKVKMLKTGSGGKSGKGALKSK